MSNHLWAKKRITAITRASLEKRYQVALEEGYSKRESMRWAAFSVERAQQGNNYRKDSIPNDHPNTRWRLGCSVHASEYTYCKIMGLPMLPRCPGEPPHDGLAGLDIVAYRIKKFYGHMKGVQLAVKALHNIRTIAGPAGLYRTQTRCISANPTMRDLCQRWAKCTKGSHLFIRTLGGFDIAKAVDSIANAKHGVTPRDLAAVGYVQKFGYTPALEELAAKQAQHWSREAWEFMRIIKNPRRRAHYLRHQEFWNEHGHLDLLYEADPELLDRAPRNLLESMHGKEDRLEPCEYAIAADYPDFIDNKENYIIRPIRNTKELQDAAKRLHNCAAFYHSSIVQGNLLLLVCYSNTVPGIREDVLQQYTVSSVKPLAMASIHIGEDRYDQMYGPCNERPKVGIRRAFESALPTYSRYWQLWSRRNG